MIYEYKVVINNKVYYSAISTDPNKAIKKVVNKIKKETR